MDKRNRNSAAGHIAKIRLCQELQGSILDVGGGGEGIIGRIYGSQVTAIDNQQEELDEAPDCCQKILMDGENMTFSDESFDNVTFFYSLMYMSKDTQEKVLVQSARILKSEGRLIIWDTAIDAAYPEPFLAELSIDANGEKVQTTYGVVKEDGGQSSSQFIEICRENGLEIMEREETEPNFRLVFRKK